MSNPENPTDGTPEVSSYNTTGPMSTDGPEDGPEDSPEDDFRSWLRILVFMSIVTLLVVNLFLYSLYQGLQARVENQDRRIGRLNGIVENLIKTNQNAEKIEKIEQKIEGINTHVKELVEAIKSDGFPQLEPKRKTRKKR